MMPRPRLTTDGFAGIVTSLVCSVIVLWFATRNESFHSSAAFASSQAAFRFTAHPATTRRAYASSSPASGVGIERSYGAPPKTRAESSMIPSRRREDPNLPSSYVAFPRTNRSDGMHKSSTVLFLSDVAVVENDGESTDEEKYSASREFRETTPGRRRSFRRYRHRLRLAAAKAPSFVFATVWRAKGKVRRRLSFWKYSLSKIKDVRSEVIETVEETLNAYEGGGFSTLFSSDALIETMKEATGEASQLDDNTPLDTAVAAISTVSGTDKKFDIGRALSPINFILKSLFLSNVAEESTIAVDEVVRPSLMRDSTNNDASSAPVQDIMRPSLSRVDSAEESTTVTKEAVAPAALPVGPRWAVAAPTTDLSGRWRLVVSDAFRRQYDAYLRSLGQPGIVRSVAVTVAGMTREEIIQSDGGRTLIIKGTNPRGEWDRSFLSSGVEIDRDVFEEIHVPVLSADSEVVLAESWWERGGTVHVSWLRGGKKYGGDFQSLRYMDGDDALVCESMFHPTDSKNKAHLVWRFCREM